MINVSNYSNICDASKEVIRTYSFWVILSIEFVLGITSVLFNSIVLILISKNSTIHTNLRILLCQLSIFIIWFSIGYAGKIIYIITTVIINPCDLITDAYTCKLQEILTTSLPVTATNYSLTIIGIERFYATLNFRTYEHYKNKWPLVLLLAFLWTVVLGQQMVPWLTMVKGQNVMPICASLLSLNTISAQTVVSLNLINEVVALIMHLLNLRINNIKLSTVYINQAQENLTARFQLDQNFKTVRTILPIVYVHIVCWVPKIACLAAVVYLHMFVLFTEQVCVAHFISLMSITFGNFYAIITLIRNPVIRNDIEKLSPSVYKFFQFIICKTRRKRFLVKVGVVESHIVDTDKHFQMLESMWGNNNANNITTTPTCKTAQAFQYISENEVNPSIN